MVFYWQQVSEILAADVKLNVAAAGKEAASDFDRLLETDEQVLASLALTVQDSYPWADSAQLTDFLRRQTNHNYFKLLGVITADKKLYLSSHRNFTSAFVADISARTLEQGKYLSVRQADPLDGADVLVQSVALYKDGRPLGTLFALQLSDRYQPLLTLSAMGDKGSS